MDVDGFGLEGGCFSVCNKRDEFVISLGMDGAFSIKVHEFYIDFLLMELIL